MINQPDPDNEHPGAAAERLWLDGDLTGAEEAALRWLELEPQNPNALMQLGVVYEWAGRYGESLGVCERLRPLAPGYAAAGTTKALFGLERWPEMLANARDWVQHMPDNRDAWFCLLAAATKLEDYATKVDAIKVLIRLEPDEPRYRWELAAALGMLERWSEMADHSRQWLDREPDSADAHVAYLVGLSRSDQHNEVIGHFEQGWPDAASNTTANSVVIYAYNEVGRYPDALAGATRILGRTDCPDDVWREQARALLQLGHYDAAATAARRYLQSDPNREFTAFSMCMLADALLGAKRYDEALPVIDQWLALEPLPSAWSRRIKALIGLERYEEAADTAETLIVMAPADPAAASLLAASLARNGDPRAAAAARRWIELDPDNPAAHRLLDELHQHDQ